VIFVTVGAQMPFDRMCRAVDEWASARGRNDVFAQIGSTEWRPAAIQYSELLTPPEFLAKVKECDVIVAHAGMGSILTALEHGKPILVMPRRGDLRETRNDHQIATAKRFLALEKVAVAFDEKEVATKLDAISSLQAADRISPYASDSLVAAVRDFVHGRGGPRGEKSQ
jgi:UDP-N-acetylglucosamine transferase subunit ALG13